MELFREVWPCSTHKRVGQNISFCKMSRPPTRYADRRCIAAPQQCEWTCKINERPLQQDYRLTANRGSFSVRTSAAPPSGTFPRFPCRSHFTYNRRVGVLSSDEVMWTSPWRTDLPLVLWRKNVYNPQISHKWLTIKSYLQRRTLPGAAEKPQLQELKWQLSWVKSIGKW